MSLFSLPSNIVAFLVGLWPPFWFTGIRFKYIAQDYRKITVTMGLHWYNKNIVGIQYGGNLFSMTDPCYMMMLMYNLGSDYKILDHSAEIEFLLPGMGSVTSHCLLTKEDIDDIKTHTLSGDKYLKRFVIEVLDEYGEVVAKIHRVVYIRKKYAQH